jgi:Na+/melibiose symporter-like transporter
MLLLKLLGTAYLLCAIVTILMVNSAIDDKIMRRVFWFLGIMMPFIFVYATFLSFRNRRVVPYDNELARIEDGIEMERVRLFGGEITSPSFSARWELAYKTSLEKLLHNAARASKQFACFEAHLHSGRAA